MHNSRFLLLRQPGILAMDVSGTSIHAAAYGFNDSASIVHSPFQNRRTPVFVPEARHKYGTIERFWSEALVPEIVDMLTDLRNQDPAYRTLPICVSFSGQINKNGEIISASSIFRKGYPSKPLNLKEAIRTSLGIDEHNIHILNNISAAAWRLNTEPPFKDDSRFLVIHVGSGFGSKIFAMSNGTKSKGVIIDEGGYAGELGHVFIAKPVFLEEDLQCDCGKYNHLASLILPDGIYALFDQFRKERTEVSDFLRAFNRDNFIDSFDRLFGKEPNLARKILDTVVNGFAATISHLILAIGLDHIALKGSLFHRLGRQSLDYFTQRLNQALGTYMKDYFVVPDGFVSVAIQTEGMGLTPNEYESFDRGLSMEGLLLYLEHYYESNYQVNSGHLDGRPSFRLTDMQLVDYCVVRTENVFDSHDRLLQQLTSDRKLLVVIDKHYNKITDGRLRTNIADYFRNRGRNVTFNSAHAAEMGMNGVAIQMISPIARRKDRLVEDKTVSHVMQIIDSARAIHLPRRGMLICVGGGVVLDIVGFAAHQFRRMVDYIRIPTTLLGQVDAGIGIKVGVNVDKDKNLIGGFYPPRHVINSTHFLNDLDETLLACGISEVLKMGLVVSRDIVEGLEAIDHSYLPLNGDTFANECPIRESLIHLMDLAVRDMLVQLQKNLLEEDLRRVVDFGHTFGPVIESFSNYRIPHGFAVALDMFLSTAMARTIPHSNGQGNLIDDHLFHRYTKLIHKFGLLVRPVIDGNDFLKKQGSDIFDMGVHNSIEHRGGNLNLVVPAITVGTAGFINLSECCQPDLSLYDAIVSEDQLRKKFDKALRRLTEMAKERDF